MNPLDELFREKLNAHKVQPSVDAWSRVEKNISKKNKGFAIWLRAASIIFLLGASFIVYRAFVQGDDMHTDQVATVNKSTTEAQPQTTTKAPEEIKQAVADKPAEKKSATVVTKTPSAPRSSTQPRVAHQEFVKDQTEVAIPNSEISNGIAMSEEKPAGAEVTSNKEKTVADKAMVVVYTLELPAQSTDVIADATASTDIEKKTGLKRVLELAREARSTENPIGELRQAKNELLAFNFSREREQRNDK